MFKLQGECFWLTDFLWECFMNLKKCFYSVISKSILLFSLISILIFSSCEVGLGESVDTENPSVEITYPPNGSVIRGSFTFAGVCADDKGVSKVFVTVRKNDDANFVKEYEAKILDGGKWTCILNEVQDDKSPTVLQEKVFPFADGKYEIKAVAIDSSNRQSDGISRTYEIDNTPPVFIISSPVVTDTENATEYGSIFKISGKIADDHAPLSSMKVSVFDQDGSKITGNEIWTFSKVDISGGTTVNAARYFTKENLSPEEEILYKNYINIYGENTEGDKVFTCTIEIEDSAKEWNEPNFDSKKEVVNTTEGNKTTKLYLNDSIYSLLMGADSEYQLEAGGIKDILNGTTKNDPVLSILNEKIIDTKETKLAFSLNKKANPIYSINGYDVKELNFASNSGSKNQTVTFQVQAGLNGTSVSPETFKLYLFGPFEKNTLTQDEIQKIYNNPEASSKTYSEKCSVIFDGTSYSKGSVATFTQAVSLPEAISSGQMYIFAASGKDLDNLDLQTSNDTVYGFQGISAGTPPKVYISEPASDGLVIKENSSLVIKGTAESAESKIASVKYEIAVYDTLKSDENGKFIKVGEISGDAVSDSGFGLPRVSYSCSVKDGTVKLEDGYTSVNPGDREIFSYVIKVTVQDDSNTESFIERNIYLDNAKPVPVITNVDPVAEKKLDASGNVSEKKINGTVTVSGKVTEKNLKSLVLTVKDKAGKTETHTYSEASFEEKIDTTMFSDGEVDFTLTAVDEAGNESSDSEQYTIDQSTDKPVIKFSNGKDSTVIKDFDKVNKTQNTFGVETNNKAVFNFTDDDGLETVKITLLDKDEKTVVDASKAENAVQIQENQTGENLKPVNPVVYTFDGSTTALVNYILPKKEGMYILEVEAFDVEYKNASGREDADKVKNYRTSVTKNYIAVSDSNFNIKFDSADIINDECSTKLVETTIKGIVTVSAEEKIKSIERYEITQDKNGEWVKKGSPVSSYKNDATEENPNTITIKKDGNYVQWQEIVPKDKMQEGVKNFRYIATDTTDVSVSIDLKWNVDDTLPELHKNAYTESIVDKWLNSTSQTLVYIVQDPKTNSYASGIDSVKYSFKNGEKPTEGYFARGASCDENGDDKAVTKEWTLYKTTFDLPEEKSTSVTVTVSDKVGNKKTDSINFKIDTIAPTDTTVSIVADQVLNKNKSLEITYSSKDATSGIKSIKIGTKNNLSGAVQIDGENAKDIASKYDFALSSFADGEYKIYLQAEDVAGNKTDVIEATSAFIVDSTNPTVKITSPVADSVVNKAVTFVGTVQDSNIADSAKPVLEYSIDGTSWTAITGTTATLDGQSWTITDVDTTKIHNTTEPQVVNFRVKFTDKAANLGTSADYKLTINQNADRPEIKLTNINISASAISSNKVMGVISDDDGDVTKLYRIATSKYTNGLVPNGSNAWKEIKVEKGTGIWTAELSNDETEGEQSWYFYVIDSKNGKFCTKDSSQLNRMYLSDSVLSKTDNTTGIAFTYDITPPAIEIKAAHGTADAVENWDDKDNIFGGEQYIWIKAIVKESVEMNANPVEITVTGAAPTLKSTTTEGTTYEYTFTPVKASSLAEGTVQISVTAKDSSGLENKNMTNVIIDTTAPTVKIITPTIALSDAVSSAISVKGIIQDNYSSIKKLQWAIPKKSTQNDEHEWKDVGTAASWEIKFASGAPDSSDSLVYYANAKDAGGDDVYNISKHGTENIYKVPMYFKATDSCGNEAIIKDQYVLVDSDGGKPKAWINSPENGATTSGLVTIYGGASDNVSVSKVCIQIDANNDGNFDENDINTMSTWISQDLEAGSLFPSSGNNKNDWYILASGTNSWKLSINSARIPTVNEKTYLRIRVRAVDDEGLTRGYSDPITVTIDSQTPTIKNLKVVQYGKNVVNPTADSVPVTEREYIAGMYISDVSVATNGKWFLVGDIHDNESIATVSFTKLESTTTNTINLNLQDQHPNEGDYKLQIPLVTNQSGVISYAIKAIDKNHAETTSNITINIDSSAPSLYTTNNSESLNVGDKLRLKSVGKVIGTGDANGTVVNNNNFFTFGDVVSEGGSGLAHLAFYFERNGSSQRIYNPMLEVSNPDNKTVISSKAAINGSKYINDDGLAVMYVTDNLRDSDDAITISSANANVRKGGLIKIAGGYSQITEVNGTTVKFSPTASTSFTTAEIVLAQVVDHQIIESLGDDNSVMNDDGDEMVETIQLIGSSYNWTASVDSTNIPDGPITIHVVAIDNAGNISRGSIATRVENNRPRIAKVLLATDLNDNDYYDWNANSAPVTTGDDEKDTKDGKAFGEFSYYSALNPNSGKAQSEVTLNSSAFKVIDGLCIIPEFVGGNTELRYILEYPANLATATKKTGAVTAMTTTSDISDKTKNVGEYSITDQISSFGGIVLNSITSGNISITFWDKTEETTQGTNSQWALLKIPVTNLESDPEKPEAKIAPFYWNSSTDNSVYINGGIKGHIELENDLPNDTFKAANVSGVYDRDPKVSGKIKLEGIVYDNVRLKNITFNGTAAGNVVGTYAGGKWTAAGSLPTGVKSFAAEDIELSQNGHYVKYEMVIDTETLNPSSPIVSDKGITVGAIDWRSNVSATSSTKTTGTTQEINGDTYNTGTTNYYRMDLVPYVTEVWTSLSEYDRNNSSVYARSSIGKYPVRVGETVTVYGWNLSNDCSVTLGGNPVTGVTCEPKNNLDVKQGTYGINMTITEEHSSGALEVTVNGISALNNKNNNQAKGKYAGDISDKDATDKEYAHGYNRRPNGINNNVLTDDIALDVWDFKVAAQPEGSSAKYVHMKVGPYLPGDANNARIGFSFKNGIGYYNMAGNARNVSGESVKLRIPTSFTTYTHIHLWNDSTTFTTWPGLLISEWDQEDGYYVYTVNASSLNYKMNNNGEGGSNKIEITSSGIWTYDGSEFTRTGDIPTNNSAPTVFSHTRMGSNFGGFTSNSFTFDSKGQTYGVAMCPDTSGKAGIAANLQFFSRATGSNNTSNSQDLNYNYLNVNNARRIENICYYKDGNLKTDEERIQVPSMASYVSGETSYVYLAYYDHGLDQVKFRIGSVGSTANDIGLGLQDLNKLTAGIGGSEDTGKIGVACSVFDSTSSSYKGDKGDAYLNVRVISSGNEASADVAVAALNNGTAVVAYYTGKELKIQYAPFANISSNNASTDTWTTKSVSTKGGKNVAMVADAAGGLHFAYSSNSGADLYYTYMSSLTATPVTMLVDSYDNVGSYCTIDVGRTSESSQWIPYITYKRDASEVALKMAYPVVNVSTEKPGASSAGFFTGNWDICTIPSANNSTNDLVNVGLCKTWSDGVIQNFPTGADDFSYNPGGTYAICNSSVIYGNGTQNPVVGYAVEQGYIEVAQKK